METGDAGEIASALRCTELDVELQENVVYCYVDAPHNPKRVRKELKHDLAAFGFAENVPDPLPIEHWDERQERYVDASGLPERERLPATLEPYEIGWAVAVEPSSVFETRKLLEELRNRRRYEIGETKSGVEVGARDEAARPCAVRRARPAPGRRLRLGSKAVLVRSLAGSRAPGRELHQPARPDAARLLVAVGPGDPETARPSIPSRSS
jgi:hypothetical protein